MKQTKLLFRYDLWVQISTYSLSNIFPRDLDIPMVMDENVAINLALAFHLACAGAQSWESPLIIGSSSTHS